MLDFLTPLSIPPGRSGNFALSLVRYPANRKFSLAPGECRWVGRQPDRKVSWPVETYWHELTENGGNWMCDLPHEQAQHYRCLKGMAGRVLVGGLGIGFAASVLAMRPEVSSVVVVERSADVIKLVAPHVRSLHKVEVIHADLFEYLPVYEGRAFDHAFFDIWRETRVDTLTGMVEPLRRLAVEKVSRPPVCWNEDVMRGHVRQALAACFLRMKYPAIYENPDMPLWAIPFFEWYQAAKPDEARFTAAVEIYSELYAIVGWESQWAAYKG